MPRALVVKVTCGAEEPERCNQAFTVVGRGRRLRRGRVALADRRGRLVRRPGPRRGLLPPRGGPVGRPARGGDRRRAASRSAPSAPPAAGSPRPTCSPACGSPAPRPSPRRSSSTAPRRSSTDPRLGPTAAAVHPTVPHWRHARQPRLPDPRDQLAGRRAGRRGALRAPDRHLRRRAAVRARRRGARRGPEVRRPVPRPGALLAPAQPAGPRAGRGRDACRCWSGCASWPSSPATSTSSSWSGWPASSAGSRPASPCARPPACCRARSSTGSGRPPAS